MKVPDFRVLVVGVSGMLGHAVFKLLSDSTDYSVYGSARSPEVRGYFEGKWRDRIFCGVDVNQADQLIDLLNRSRPNVIINCVGLIKQLSDSKDPLAAIPINSILPHRLAKLASLIDARLVQISTDCVFSGKKGNYVEDDIPDASDVYGRSKLLGEVGYPNSVTLRTSIIGHELNAANSLVNWFLSQEGVVKGYQQAFFSGLPTVELARVIRDFVIPIPELTGLYHVSAARISKLELLRLVASTYQKCVTIESDSSLSIDRSLDSTRFRSRTGYVPSPWPELVQRMRDFG